MRQFVPMTDDMLYRAGGPPEPLVPYRPGVLCWRLLSHTDQQPGSLCGEPTQIDAQRFTVSVSPGLTPSFSAMPALSSSTYCAAAPEG